MISGRRAVFSAVTTSLLNCMGIFLGFALQALLSKKFGTKSAMDAYIVAGTLPLFIPTVFVMAFHSAFIPIFHEYQKEAGDKKAWEMGQMFFFGFAVVLFVLTIAGYPLLPYLLNILAPGFTGERFKLALNLSYIMFPLMLFSGITGMLNSLQNSVFMFSRPAAAPLCNMAVNLSVVWFYEPTLGIYSAAVGYLLGGIAQTLFMLPVVFRNSKFRFKFDFKHPKLKKCWQLMFPLLIAQMFGKSDQIIERFVASQLPAGSISYISYAYRLISNFINLIGTSITVVAFPMLSGISHDSKKMGSAVSSVVELWLVLVTPLIGSLLLLRIPVIQLLYQRGAFTYTSTINTASALLAYSGIFLISIGVGGTTLYALQKTKFILYLCIITAISNAFLAVVLTKYIGFQGPALAYSFKIILSNIISFSYFHFYLGIKLRKGLLKQVATTLFSNGVAIFLVKEAQPTLYKLCSGISSNTLLHLSFITMAFIYYMVVYSCVMLLVDRQSIKDIYYLIKPKKEA